MSGPVSLPSVDPRPSEAGHETTSPPATAAAVERLTGPPGAHVRGRVDDPAIRCDHTSLSPTATARPACGTLSCPIRITSLSCSEARLMKRHSVSSVLCRRSSWLVARAARRRRRPARRSSFKFDGCIGSVINKIGGARPMRALVTTSAIKGNRMAHQFRRRPVEIIDLQRREDLHARHEEEGIQGHDVRRDARRRWTKARKSRRGAEEAA